MPTDPITLVETTDDYGEALIDKVRPTQQKRHWWHVSAISSDTTVDDDSEFLSVTATGSGDVTVTMPDASASAGQSVIIYCEAISSGNSVVVDSNTSGDTVGGAASQSIVAAEKFIHLISDGGTNWIVYLDGR